MIYVSAFEERPHDLLGGDVKTPSILEGAPPLNNISGSTMRDSTLIDSAKDVKLMYEDKKGPRAVLEVNNMQRVNNMQGVNNMQKVNNMQNVNNIGSGISVVVEKNVSSSVKNKREPARNLISKKLTGVHDEKEVLESQDFSKALNAGINMKQKRNFANDTPTGRLMFIDRIKDGIENSSGRSVDGLIMKSSVATEVDGNEVSLVLF